MHEVGLMQQAVAIALRHAEQAGAGRIQSLRLRVGALSGVVPDSLSLAFAVAAQGTIAEKAHLDIEEVPVTCYCKGCQKEFTPVSVIFACPLCGRLSADIRGGREFSVESIQVD